jgi:hypothetical protein
MGRVDPAAECRGRTVRLPRVWTMMWPLMVALMTTGWGPAVRSQGDPGRAAGPRSGAKGSDPLARQENALEFRVVDARDKTPLSDVSIVVVAAEVTGATTLATDEDGHCRIAIPKRVTQFVGISARKEGFVPVRVAWSGHDIGAVLPESYTLALEPGTPIGGIVRDTLGRPVVGALVYVWFEREQPRNEWECVFLEDDYHVETDAHGGWRCTMMPDSLSVKDRLMFRLIHPDYVSEPVGYRRSLPIEKLRRMTSVMVMEDGVALTGRVVNSRGLPVMGARVRLQGPGFMINSALLTPEQADCLQTETDADGRYRFRHIEPGERQVMVEAREYVRLDARVVAGARLEPAEIRLTSVEEMEEAARVARLDSERMLEVEEEAGPNDIPQRWVMNGILIVVAGVSLILILWRWILERRRVL